MALALVGAFLTGFFSLAVVALEETSSFGTLALALVGAFLTGFLSVSDLAFNAAPKISPRLAPESDDPY